MINASGMACLTDFGLSSVLYNTGTLTNMARSRGTLRWMSPELLGNLDQVQDVGQPTEASDIYAVAMVFWEASHFFAVISSRFLYQCTEI